MGLLEKAQEKKQKLEEIDNEILYQEKVELSQEKDDIKKEFQEKLTEEGKSGDFLYKRRDDVKFKKEII